MSWNTGTGYVSGSFLTFSLINGIGNDLRTRGGDVDGAGFGFANNSFLTLNPASLPGSPANGMLAINASNQLQMYYASAWHNVGTGGDGSWTNATLANSWANAFSTTRYKKDGQGTVDVQGSVNNGTVPTTVAITMFTLPSGYRPSQVIYRQALCASNVTVPWTLADAAIQILTTGEVQLIKCASNVFVAFGFTLSTL